MKISMDWINDFVDLKEITPEELYKRVTLSICEVENVEAQGLFWSDIKVVQIESVKRHPEADKLNLVTFCYGNGLYKEVVCGAPNVRQGLKVPYAPLGTVLPGGFKLEAKKIRGILSEGMLCSEKELGLSEESHGLMELASDAPVGQTLGVYLKKRSDLLLDIDNKSLTHRPDLWGHYGMAREMAALFHKELKNPFTKKWDHSSRAASPVKVSCEGESACLAYHGFSVDNIEVKESPAYIQERLLAVGLRPINNIVDISNYVMLELGIPNHIFDRDQVGDQIILKRLGHEESFVTLDEVSRKLMPHDTVVANGEGKPLVIAGIMGGLSSGVTEKTKNIFVEIANWKYGEVRKTSARLGLRTDSSQRYEKSLDSALLERTGLRLLELLLEVCPNASVVGQWESVGPHVDTPPKTLVIETSVERINALLGKDLASAQIESIFLALDFKIEKEGERMLVTVPSYRATKDVEFEADLVEEIGRMIGFDNIPALPPMAALTAVRLTPVQQLFRKLQDFWVLQAKAYEVYTHPLTGKDWPLECEWPDLSEDLVLVNALSHEHDRLRSSMVPSLLKAIQLNQKHCDHFRLFELGRFFGKGWSEKKALSVAFYKRDESSFMELANTMESCLSYCGLEGELFPDNERLSSFNQLVPPKWIGRHPHEFLHIQVMGKAVGFITTLHPLLCKKLKLKEGAAILVLDLTLFENKEHKSKAIFKPIAKYPRSVFDCTVVVPERAFVGDIAKNLKKQFKKPELLSVEVVTIYPLENQLKALTLRSTFGSDEKTLDGEWIKEAETTVMALLNKAGYPLR